MKKQLTIYLITFLMVSLFVPQQIKAQSPPQKMSYQAVIRDSNNALITSTMVGMQISILQGSSTGTVVYKETQTPTSNVNGLVSIKIGAGTVLSGTFSAIDWANGPFYIKTDTDPNPTSSGFNYSITGTSQLLSVPYALYAETSGSGGSGNYWELDGNLGTLDNGNYFIGTTDNIPLNFKVNGDKAGRIDHLLFNTFFGYQSGNVNTTGKWNTAIGNIALRDNTIGHDNTAIGDETLTFNTTGVQNTALGEGTLFKNTVGNDNLAAGYTALGSNTTGSQNTALGNYALFTNTTSGNNAAFGFKSLWKNTSGGNNTASGSFSLTANTSGGNNTSLGYQAMQANIIGSQNTAVGSGALLVSNANFNTATGANSLYANTTGFNNSAFGTAALQFNVSGNYNTAVGRGALVSNQLGNNNTAIGYGADINSDNLSNTTALGNGAIATANNQIRLGNADVSSLYFGTANNLTVTTDSIPNMYYDYATGQIMRSTASASNTANNWNLTGNAGTSAGLNFLGTTDLQPLMFKVNSVESGLIDYDPNKANTFFGYQSGNANITGYSNTANGFKTLLSNTTGNRNVANGGSALSANTTGYFNTANGYHALVYNTTGNQNTANGTSSLGSNTIGNNNTADGLDALFSNTTGSDNTAVGYFALFSTIASNGNTALGNNAGDNNINNGDYNTFIGYNAYADKDGYTNTTALGYGAMTTASNQVRMGNANVSSLYFGTANNLAVTTDSIPNMYYDYATGQIMRSTVLANNSANNWNLTGNSISSTDFIGTTNNVPLTFKVNNIFAGRIDNMLGNVFFGSASGINNNTTASSNTAIGYFALNTNISGTSNTALGANTLQLNTGGNNTAIGGGALANNSTGSLNVAVGNQALMTTTSGTKNTALGSAAYMTGTLTNSTVIGYGAQTTDSNTIQLGDANVINVNTAGTYTAGAVTYLNTDGTSGQVLTTNGSGDTSWAPMTGSIGGFTHYLGEDFNGGIIYYLYKGSDGLEHGLIVSKTESTAVWQVTPTTTNADRTEDGTYNTGLMTGSAAATYIGTLGSGWYLPSIDELGLLYYNRYSAQKGLRSGGFTLLSTMAGYWSSTEKDVNEAFYFIFSFAGQVSNKNNSYTVRGVRAF